MASISGLLQRGGALLFIACGLAHSASATGIAQWSFDEIEPGGIIKDSVGNAHAKVIGGIAPDLLQTGLHGKAIILDMAKNHLRVDAKYAQNLSDDFTIRCVIFPFNVESYRTIIWKGNRKTDPEAVNFYLGIRDKKIEFKSKDAQGQWMVHSTGKVLNENNWYDIGIYYRDGVVEMTLNGEPCLSTSHSDEPADAALVPNDFPLIIGQGATIKVDTFHYFGLLDEIKISEGRQLDPDEQWLDRIQRYEMEKAVQEQKEGAESRQRNEQWLEAYAALFKKRAKSPDAPFIAVTLPSTRRINKHNGFVEEIADLDASIKLSAAGNEYEGAQILVVSGPERNADSISVQISDLTNEGGNVIPASLASWGWIKSIESVKPDISVEFIGKIPDAIIEHEKTFKVTASDFTPVFTRFYIPAKTPAGLYKGSVTLTREEFQEIIPVEIQVYPFDLPKKGSLRVSFSFFEDFYREWHGLASLSDEQKRSIYDFLLNYRIPPSNIYTSLPVYPELRFLNELKDRTNFFTIQGWNEVLSASQAEARIKEYGKTLEDIQKLGMTDDVYFYGIDELSGHMGKSLPAATQAHEYLSKNFPSLRTMQTSFPIPELRPLFNVWIPLLDSFADPRELAELEEVRKESRELWWYAADQPVHPLPNFYLDYPVFDSRIVMVLTYKYKLDGILYWSINREWKTNMDIRDTWPDADWKPYIYHVSLGYRKQRNGMGNLIYPGKDGCIYASLRLENVRDGLEDYEYLKLLETMADQLEEKKGAVPEVAEARKLLAVPDEVAVSVGQYNSDPSALMNYRERIAAMIDRIQKANL